MRSVHTKVWKNAVIGTLAYFTEQGLVKEIVRERRNERGKERKSVRKKGRGENEVYLQLRRNIYVVSSYCNVRPGTY
jgi:hypothetical protein